MSTPPTPSLTEERRQILHDYFSKTIDIDRLGQGKFPLRGICSMEHINLALDASLGEEPDETRVFPSAIDFPELSYSMATILVAFNDATDEAVLCSDAWRLGLLPRYPEATDSDSADRRRLEMIRDWLASHGITFQEQLALTVNHVVRVGPKGHGAIGLYQLLGKTAQGRSLHDALSISAEEYIAFLHTLICP